MNAVLLTFTLVSRGAVAMDIPPEIIEHIVALGKCKNIF